MCPIYEYFCAGCEQSFEKLEKSDSPKVCTCLNCLFEARRVDCPGGDFRISGVGIADPRSMRD